MKKIFLKSYLNNNLGDDLFIDIITKRYKNDMFYLLTYKKENAKFNSNVKIYNWKVNKLLNRIIKLATLNIVNLEKIYIKKCDATVLIGGSMFIEKKHKKINLNSKKSNFFVLGINFGPFESEEFKNYYDKIFSMAQDVCFRDKYSYDLFSNLDNVRYTYDIVFGLKLKDVEMQEEKNVIISVIDCNKKCEPKNKDKYEQLIVDLINKFYDLQYNITLMSFCKNEGDENAIESILDKIQNNNVKKTIKQYNYNGNIEEALNVLQKSSIIVGSRFHANILGMLMNKTILPIAYSDKTIHTLNDIGYKGKVIDIRKLDQFNVNNLTENDLTYKLNIDKIRKEAEKHFEKLDKFLK